MIEISKENYYTPEADSSTFSVSQYKLFKQCEAKALAKVKGQYRQADNEAFLLAKERLNSSRQIIQDYSALEELQKVNLKALIKLQIR